MSGALGPIHTIVGFTLDPAPPPAEYVAVSGGIFRDCLVHDLDILRWVTGREVVEVYATGANLGDDYIRAADDVDAVAVDADAGRRRRSSSSPPAATTAPATTSAWSCAGICDSVAVGMDRRTPLRSLQPGSSRASPGLRPVPGPVRRPPTPPRWRPSPTLVAAAAGPARARCPTHWPLSCSRKRATSPGASAAGSRSGEMPGMSDACVRRDVWPVRRSPGGSARCPAGAHQLPAPHRPVRDGRARSAAPVSSAPTASCRRRPRPRPRPGRARPERGRRVHPRRRAPPGRRPGRRLRLAARAIRRRRLPASPCSPRSAARTATRPARARRRGLADPVHEPGPPRRRRPLDHGLRGTLHPHVGHARRAPGRRREGARRLRDRAAPGHRAPAWSAAVTR